MLDNVGRKLTIKTVIPAQAGIYRDEPASVKMDTDLRRHRVN
jgi:hypothetical protein